MKPERLKLGFPTQGWKQFLTARNEMLDKFDRAREKAQSHKVETYHGNVAEAEFRKWLGGFLPKRYGVTSGYVVSQGIRGDQPTPHFDVIIYDAMNAPVLWIEDDSDTSSAGRSMALPAEHVLGILEVKAALNSTSAQKAITHLNDLAPLLQDVDAPDERYKLYLPRNFFCGIIFFELRDSDKYSETAVTALIDGISLRGYIGGLVLRGEGHKKPASGKINILRSESPIESTINKSKESLLDSMPISKSVAVTNNLHFCTSLSWAERSFAEFAFDLLAIMQGQYQLGRVSSFHGYGATL